MDMALCEHYNSDDSGIIANAANHAETLLDALEQLQPDIKQGAARNSGNHPTWGALNGAFGVIAA